MNSESVRPGEGMLVYELIPSYDGIIKEAGSVRIIKTIGHETGSETTARIEV